MLASTALRGEPMEILYDCMKAAAVTRSEMIHVGRQLARPSSLARPIHMTRLVSCDQRWLVALMRTRGGYLVEL